jgi:hypothetical protein
VTPPDPWPIWCGWLVHPDPPQRACTLPAGWAVRTPWRAIVVCDAHHLDGLRWVRQGRPPDTPDQPAQDIDLWPDPHGTLF